MPLDEHADWRLPPEAQGGVYRDITDLFMAPVDAAMVAKEQASVKRTYLGASGIGDPCERAAHLSYRAKKPFDDPRLLRTFAHGHAIEALYEGHFKLAYNLVTEDLDGKQFGFSELDDRFKGHIDGVFLGALPGIDSPFQFPCLWEHKGLNSQGIANLKRQGLFLAYPKYYAQANLYAYLVRPVIDGVEYDLSRNPIIFTAANKNNDLVHVEAIVPNRANARYHYERAMRILDGGIDPFDVPRYSEDRNHMVCKLCSYRDVCHGPAPKDFL